MILIILCFVIIFVFIIYSGSCIPAAAYALLQCINVVIPSIFPFLVITELLGKTDFYDKAGKLLDKFTRKFFKISGIGSAVILMGYMCGFPGAAKITSDLYKDRKISYEDAIRLSVFTNNPGPLFIIGTIGYGMLNSISAGILLFLSQITSSILTGIIINRFINIKSIQHSSNLIKSQIIKRKIDYSSISESITNAFYTMIPITGTIVFFAFFSEAIIASDISFYLLKIIKSECYIKYLNSFIKCCFEITGGLSSMIPLYLNSNLILPIISLICSWSGISIHMQIIGFYSKANIETKYYFLGKVLNMIISFYISIFFNRFS